MGLERLIGTGVVGVLNSPADYAVPRAGLRGLWRRHLVANAAVRSSAYMEALFKRHFPQCALIESADGEMAGDVVDRAQVIVLLFPDSIGMDFATIERTVALRWPSKRVLALNGRGRLFRLDQDMRRRLALRRFLETCRIPEFIFFLVFMLVTPFLLLFDVIRGRR